MDFSMGQGRYVLNVDAKALRTLAGENYPGTTQDGATRSTMSRDAGPQGPQTARLDQLRRKRRTSLPHSGTSHSEEHVALLKAGKRLGWREIRLPSGEVIPEGEEAWRQFCLETMGNDLFDALMAVKVRLSSGGSARRSKAIE
jgi:hypothetical protein